MSMIMDNTETRHGKGRRYLRDFDAHPVDCVNNPCYIVASIGSDVFMELVFV